MEKQNKRNKKLGEQLSEFTVLYEPVEWKLYQGGSGLGISQFEGNKFNLIIEESEIKASKKLDEMSKLSFRFTYEGSDICFNLYKAYELPENVKDGIYNERDLNPQYSFDVEAVNPTKQAKMIYKAVLDEVQTRREENCVDDSPNILAPDILDEPISAVDDQAIDPFDLPF